MNKEVPPYLQLCRRVTTILKSKVLLLHYASVLVRVNHLWRVPRHGIKGNLTPRYLVPSYVVKRGTIASLDVFHTRHLNRCLRTFLPWVDHEILDLLEDPSSRSHSLFPLVQLSNIVKWRNQSFMTSWINLFSKEDHRGINKIVED
jgi:hypothetical protein